VLVRYGGSFRGVKAQQAELRGAKGVLIYSDPEDDGFVKGPVYPEGPWRPADGIQRGSIQYIFNYPGDPLTPGLPALAGTPRLDPAAAGNLPHIPTTPISYLEELRAVQEQTEGAARLELSRLAAAAQRWGAAAADLEARAGALLAEGDDQGRRAARAIARINRVLMRQEGALTTLQGLPGRPWFRHQVYAPGLVTGYAAQFLPGLRDAVEQGDEDTATRYRGLLLDSLRAATRLARRGARG